MANRCIALNREGDPCSAVPRPGRAWCQWHDPDLAEERRRWQLEGGRNKANSARAKKRILSGALDLQEIDGALCGALTDVLAGDLEPGIATAAASLARTITAVRQVTDLEKRLEALEARRGWSA